MWGKIFFDLAVRNAVRWISECDKETFAYVKTPTPKLYFDILNIGEGKRTQNEVPSAEYLLLVFEFGLGVTQATLDFFFDGKTNNYKKYEKEVARTGAYD